MFSKIALFSLVISALSVNAFVVPITRSPAPKPESWSQWGQNIGNYYVDKYGSPDQVPGLPRFKREPETWEGWGTNIGNYHANKYSSRAVPSGLPQLKRGYSPGAGASAQSAEIIGASSAKREPETWNFIPDSGPGLPPFGDKYETQEEWETNIGNYYADEYSSAPELPRLPRRAFPQPEAWEEWGANIGNYYANLYSTPDSALGPLPFKREHGTWEE